MIIGDIVRADIVDDAETTSPLSPEDGRDQTPSNDPSSRWPSILCHETFSLHTSDPTSIIYARGGFNPEQRAPGDDDDARGSSGRRCTHSSSPASGGDATTRRTRSPRRRSRSGPRRASSGGGSGSARRGGAGAHPRPSPGRCGEATTWPGRRTRSDRRIGARKTSPPPPRPSMMPMIVASSSCCSFLVVKRENKKIKTKIAVSSKVDMVFSKYPILLYRSVHGIIREIDTMHSSGNYYLPDTSETYDTHTCCATHTSQLFGEKF